MNILKNRIAPFAAILLILVAVIILALFDNATQAAFGILVLSTTLTAVSSVATYMQALEARRQRENTERPEVAVYFQAAGNHLMYCIIHNLGKLPARNVSVRFDPSPVRNDGKLLQDQSLFAKSIPFLPPNEKYWRHLAPSHTALQMNPNPFKIHVEYSSSEGVSFTDDFIVDLTIMAEANDPEPPIAHQLGKITNSLDALRKTMEKENFKWTTTEADDPKTS